MKIISFAILGSILIFVGCSDTKKANEPNILTGVTLQSLVINATNGDRIANDSLSSLVDFELIENNLYISIEVDSFYIDTLKYFSVLLQYPNPIYNRLAIYDSATNCFLIDKSLNGKISLEVIEVQDQKFVKAVERFIAEDALGLVRLSFYRKVDHSFNLVYRSFAELQTSKNLFYQTIYSISADTINTRIQVPRKYRLNNKEDVFLFDNAIKSYRSNESVFDSLVYGEIADYNSKVKKSKSR